MDENDDDAYVNEGESVEVRISDLERKVQDQADEIVSLKSTLADVLRRLAQIEGRVPVLTSTTTPPPPQTSSPGLEFLRRSPSAYSLRSSNGATSPTFNSNSGRNMNNYHRHSLTNHIPVLAANVRPSSQRQTHHQSAMSLLNTNGKHHRSGGGGGGDCNSSGSLSPTPAAPAQSSSTNKMSPNRQISLSVSNLAKMKKFSISQEMSNNSSHHSSPIRRPPSGSLFNINSRSSASPTQMKHGTKDVHLNEEDGTLKMYLQGHPIVFHIPTDYLNEYIFRKVNSAPLHRLKLDWVYGYRGRDCRCNLFLLPTGEIVYFVAAVVVLYNVDEQIQRHYLEHTDDIKCLTVHPNKLLIATGQVGGYNRRNNQPHVRVWDSVSLHTLHIIGVGDFERAASCIAFSKTDGGSLLCVFDDSNEHTISIWEWQKGESGFKISETKSSSETVLAVEFHPMDRYTVISIGKGHVHFWDFEGGTLAKKIGLFEKHDKPKYILSMAFSDLGDLLTGDSNGNIMIWNKGSNRVNRMIYGAHDAGVFSLCSMKNGTFLSGGGRDRKIVEWDESFNATGREAKVSESMGGVRTLTQGKGTMILIGTVKNCILQGSLSMGFSPVVQGHTDEIWALGIHPTQNQFLTGGFDRNIHLWDSMSHSVVWSKEMNEGISCACFSPDGNTLVVSTKFGDWSVLDAATKQVYSMHNDGGGEAISCLKFSPDGGYLAIGSHDNFVYVYQVTNECRKFDRIGRCTGHSSYIKHLDWSVDSTYLQSESGDYELLYWNASVCRQVSNMSIARDVKWHTQTCTLGFSVFGIWPEVADGTDLNTCDRSHSGRLLVTGDDFGKVNLYAYPACQPKCLHHVYQGHSSHVTSVGFLPDDSRVISTGGKDCAVLQWSLS